MDYNHRVLPFYMTYPMSEGVIPYSGMPSNGREEDTVMRDLEYLQQMYPKEAKRYQVRISEILDNMDYEGSMIYDEYPDKWQLYHLTDTILKILKQEAQKEAFEAQDCCEVISPEKWEWTSDMVQILLFYEIYKRRHKRKRGYFKF